MMDNKWQHEADVVVVGYGGAGAIAAIAAHDAGARVRIVEKQPCDTPTETKHTPNTRMCGGAWYCPTDAEKAIRYLEGMAKVANETVDPHRKEMISTFVKNLIDSPQWLRSIGIDPGPMQELTPALVEDLKTKKRPPINGEGVSGITLADFGDIQGADSSGIYMAKSSAEYRDGAALFKTFTDAVAARNIEIMWETAGEHLVTENGEVRGIIASQRGKPVAIKAKRAVILTCGGFEFNHWMIENYLKVSPVHFYGNPGNTGDGVNMAIEVGAALWHMNSASWRVTMKFPEAPVAFATQHHETASIFVDKRGRRFANERFKMHAFGYELTNYDGNAMCYLRVPCYWVFDEKRRAMGPLASYHGACNPPGGVMGDIYYIWSKDNQREIDRGWIMKGNTIEELAYKILADPDNGGLMNPPVLRDTIRQYNGFQKNGVDPDFNKPKRWLQPLEDPPYYAAKLWPGGPNTQGGPKRNTRANVLRIDNSPIARLYSAGELGSVWGMLYQGAGNIAECITFGRIAGTNAADEKAWD